MYYILMGPNLTSGNLSLTFYMLHTMSSGVDWDGRAEELVVALYD